MKIVLGVLLVLFSSAAFADAGKCGALGRVGGEDRVCAQYDNTDAATCAKAGGQAWCSWEPATPEAMIPAWLDFSLVSGQIPGVGEVELKPTSTGKIQVTEHRPSHRCDHSNFPNPCDPAPGRTIVYEVSATVVHLPVTDEPLVIQLGDRFQLKRAIPGMDSNVKFFLVRMGTGDDTDYPLTVVANIGWGVQK